MSAHEADDDDFKGIEPVLAEAARNTISVVRELCTMKGLKFGYDLAILQGILGKAYHLANIQQDPRLRTVRVASTVAADIIILRPFNYFSTPAGLIFADAYVHENGLTMPFGWFKQMDREITRMLAIAPLTESQLQREIEAYLSRFVRQQS